MKKLNILFEDDNILAIEKDAGILSVPDRYDPQIPNLKHLLQNKDENIRVVHRLDKDTSGVLLFAKNEIAQSHLQLQFESNTIKKHYLALTVGRLNDDEGLIDEPLVADENRPGRMRVFKKGKNSKTAWKINTAFQQHTLLDVFPRTGRTHQIRVHLAHIGHSILCDPMYGNRRPFYLSSIKRNMNFGKFEEERPLLSRTALHAYSITFKNLDNTEVSITCDLPKDMRAVINQMRKCCLVE